MQLVNGVELSCTWGGATIHVLGYGFDVNAAPLVEAIAKLHDGRWLRSEEISRKLALKGMPGALEGARQMQQELGDSGNAPARPHLPTGWCVKVSSRIAPKRSASGWAPASWATSSSTGRPWKNRRHAARSQRLGQPGASVALRFHPQQAPKADCRLYSSRRARD
jgi:predicted metal-dependent phosphoesterase TrpH